MWIKMISMISSNWTVVPILLVSGLAWFILLVQTCEDMDEKESLQKGYCLNNYIYISAILEVIVNDWIRKSDRWDIKKYLYLVEGILFLFAFIVDITRKGTIKKKIQVIIRHILAGIFIYIIFEFIWDIICMLTAIVGWFVKPIIRQIRENSLSDNITYLIVFILGIITIIVGGFVAYLAFWVYAFIGATLGRIKEAIFGSSDYGRYDYGDDDDDDYDDDDYEYYDNGRNDEWIIDPYGESRKIEHLSGMSGGRYEDSHGKWHDLYGSGDSGYWDDDGDQYYNYGDDTYRDD